MSEQNVTLISSNKITAYICTYMKYDNIMYAFNLTFNVYDNIIFFSKVNNNCILLVKMNIIFLSCFFCISRFKWSHNILRLYYVMGLSLSVCRRSGFCATTNNKIMKTKEDYWSLDVSWMIDLHFVFFFENVNMA